MIEQTRGLVPAEIGHSRIRNRPLSASKTEFNGIGELRNHIRNRAGVCSKTNRPAQGRNQWLGILEFLDGPADTRVRRHGQCGLWLLR
jgi:hypothetical protein